MQITLDDQNMLGVAEQGQAFDLSGHHNFPQLILLFLLSLSYLLSV